MAEQLSVAEVLSRAADLIEPEGRWGQNWEALGADGRIRLATSPEATCWCLIGAVHKVGGPAARDRVLPALSKVIRGKPWDWNDRKCRTQTEVVSKLREASALAAERGL